MSDWDTGGGEEGDPLDELLEQYDSGLTADQALRAAVGRHPMSECLFVCPDGVKVLVVVPDEDLRGVVVTDPATGEARPCRDLDTALAEDPRLQLAPGAEIVVGDQDVDPWNFVEAHAASLRYPADAWQGANEDCIWRSDSEWVITVNGERIDIDLTLGMVSGAPAEVEAGTILHFELEETSVSLDVDDQGLVWYDTGVTVHFLVGPARQPITRHLQVLSDNEPYEYGRVLSIHSDLLTRAEVAAFLQHPRFDLDEHLGEDINVSCADWEGTLDELMGYRAGGEDPEDNQDDGQPGP